ncbi:MAG: lysophospholipid acyltransferase family protein [Planctomycetes bacterium]|nr:lysophospholipid acyltransferase family protein [Planctomycetota bacterium]
MSPHIHNSVRSRRSPASAAKGPERRRRDRERSRRVRFAIVRIVSACVRRLPLRVATALGDVAGLAAWMFDRKRRGRALRQLELAFGDAMPADERRRVARRCHRLLGRAVFAWYPLQRLGADGALRHVAGDVPPDVRAALDAGRGAVLVSPHTGMLELAGLWYARRLGAVAVVRDSAGDPVAARQVEMRREIGVRTVEHGGARELVRVLRAGGVVAMLADHDIHRARGAFVPFFGRPAHTPVGPAALAVRLGVPVIFAWIEWRSFTRHEMRFGPLLEPRPGLVGEDATLELTARITAAVEACVRARPAEWIWMHDRWRTRPEDLPEAPCWPRTT